MHRILHLMEYSFDYCMLFGEVFLSDDRQGCALVLLPDKVKLTFRRILLDLRLILRSVGFRHLRKVLQRESLIKQLHPREPFAYLWFIGVAPAMQQRGIGSGLLRELLGHYDQGRLPVYLETSVERNVSFYERAGFAVYEKLDAGYVLYCLKRAARLYAD